MKFLPIAIAIVSSFASVVEGVKDGDDTPRKLRPNNNRPGLGPPSGLPWSPSDCNLSGNYMVSSTANSFCKIKSFEGNEPVKFCPTKDYGLTLDADKDGTLTGSSYFVKASTDGKQDIFSLIGFWDKESCTFNAVSTTTAFTIEGKATGDNRVYVKALRPGVPEDGQQLAIALQGELEKGINFDNFLDINIDRRYQGAVFLTNGYYGLNWSFMGAGDYRGLVGREGFDGTGVGYYTGMESENQVAFTFLPATDGEEEVIPSSIWSEFPFSITSGFFTPAWTINMTLILRGYTVVGEEDPLVGGELVGEYVMTLGAPQDGPVFITLPEGFDNINRFEINSAGGDNDETLGCDVTLSTCDCRQVAIDNLAITGEGIVPKAA